ncbi:MAG: hypothetical protein ABFD97_12770 [Syntrophobacter sp.]
MESLSAVDFSLKALANFGLSGLVLILWYLSDRNHQKTLKQYREDVIEHRRLYDEGLREVRRMYENNVELVKGYAKIADGFQDLVVLNTQTLTKLCDSVNSNQYCPQVRLKKAAAGRED